MSAFVHRTNAALAKDPRGRGFRLRVPCLDDWVRTFDHLRDIEVVLSLSAGCGDPRYNNGKYAAIEAGADAQRLERLQPR